MISAKERLKLLYDIIADAGDMANVDLHAELGKRMKMMDMQKMQRSAAQMLKQPLLTAQQPPNGTIPPQTGLSTPQDQNGLNDPGVAQNAQAPQSNPNQMEGQGGMKLP